jgi:hypothetical protein
MENFVSRHKSICKILKQHRPSFLYPVRSCHIGLAWTDNSYKGLSRLRRSLRQAVRSLKSHSTTMAYARNYARNISSRGNSRNVTSSAVAKTVASDSHRLSHLQLYSCRSAVCKSKTLTSYMRSFFRVSAVQQNVCCASIPLLNADPF